MPSVRVSMVSTNAGRKYNTTSLTLIESDRKSQIPQGLEMELINHKIATNTLEDEWMPAAQTYFESFHSKIAFGYSSSQDLRDRRDTVLDNLKRKIDPAAPTYDTFHQGSYELSTGIHPIDGNPDMDIGIVFNCSIDDYEDPLTLKKYVRDALSHHGRTVDIKRPCVTVTYFENGNPYQHIDFAIYATGPDGRTRLAWGKPGMAVSEREWRLSLAKDLTATINGKYKGAESDQFRRCVRAIKRWRDLKIGHKNTPSIGLTAAAHRYFEPAFNIVSGKAEDIVALRKLVSSMLANWGYRRLWMPLPVEPYSDLFEKMTNIQMDIFKERLTSLLNDLSEAYAHADTHEACKILNRQFGEDFPVPPKEDTTKSSGPGVGHTGTSA